MTLNSEITNENIEVDAKVIKEYPLYYRSRHGSWRIEIGVDLDDHSYDPEQAIYTEEGDDPTGNWGMMGYLFAEEQILNTTANFAAKELL
jgi:hypothetical protein